MTQPSTDPAKPATIYDVARRAGVSHQTVAMVLRGHEGFRAETRERVQTALDELSYRPNLSARSLATARSHRIGALAYELLEVGPSKTIQGASTRSREAGYLLDIVSLDPTDDRAVHRALDSLGRQNLAGVLAFAPIDQIEREISTIGFDLPFIAEAEVDAPDPHLLNGQGMRLIVDHLVGLGHRRFFELSGPGDWVASRNRSRSLQLALEERGAKLIGSVSGDWSAASGYAAAATIPPDTAATAVIVANDQMALGAQLALSAAGFDIPGAISVTGFDDIPEAAFFRPPLTTVKVDYGIQGGILVDRLLTAIGETVAAPLRAVSPQLLVRASTGPARSPQ